MFLSNEMVAAIRNAASAVNEDVIQPHSNVDLSLEAAIARKKTQVARTVAAKHMEGARQAEVYSLVKDRDYVFPTWGSRLSRRPSVEWLDRIAADVFAYCVTMGFKTSLAKFSGKGKSHSAIVVEWELPEDACRELSGDLRDGGFATALRDQTATARAKEALRLREERTKQARVGIEAARKALKLAATGGTHQTIVLSIQNNMSNIDPDNLDTWEGDVIKFCKGVGLKVSVTSTTGWRGNHHHYVTASWDQPPTL